MIDTIRDLTIEGIYKTLPGYTIGDQEPGDRFLDEVEPKMGDYRLDSGVYLVRFEEGVPVGRYAYLYPSREIMYAGCMLNAPGLEQGDDVEAILYCPNNIRVTPDAKLGEIWTVKTKVWSA